MTRGAYGFTASGLATEGTEIIERELDHEVRAGWGLSLRF
jgi:hypothetical protein